LHRCGSSGAFFKGAEKKRRQRLDEGVIRDLLHGDLMVVLVDPGSVVVPLDKLLTLPVPDDPSGWCDGDYIGIPQYMTEVRKKLQAPFSMTVIFSPKSFGLAVLKSTRIRLLADANYVRSVWELYGRLTCITLPSGRWCNYHNDDILVDPTSDYMLLLRTKPCKSQSKCPNSTGLCMAHYNSQYRLIGTVVGMISRG
jgi:hypothetical protein